MRRMIAIMILGTLSASALGVEGYSERWERVSAKHDLLIATDEGAAYERKLVSVHNSFWRDVYAACNAQGRREGVKFFRAIAVVDEAGTVTEFLPNPNSPHFRCFVEQMVGRNYPAPPVAPFYERFKITFPDH
jgi:hypothetical protein